MKTGLTIVGKTPLDNNKIGEILDELEIHGEWNPREGYWFLPEEEENYDDLELEIVPTLDREGVSYRLEGIFTEGNKYNKEKPKMKAQTLSEEFLKMQKVAGLITESQLEEVQSEYYQELVNNWKEQGLDYDAVVVELERMGFDEGTAQSLANKSYGEHEPEELSEVKTPRAYYILNGESKIDTKNPVSNELVGSWDKMGDNSTYLLLDIQGRKFILSGGGKGYEDVGESIYLFDDGNKTTKFPSSYDMRQKRYKLYFHGVPAKVIAKAYGSEEIKNFPQGKYQLYVMK